MVRIAILFLLPSIITANTKAGYVGYEDLFIFKQGEIQKDEIWSGKILLLANVIVPEDITIEIKADTWLVFNEVDLQNTGQNPHQPELIIHGSVHRPSGPHKVQMLALGAPQVQSYINTRLDKKTIVLEPSEEPLTDLKQDLHKSRRYYAIIWALMYSLWLII